MVERKYSYHTMLDLLTNVQQMYPGKTIDNIIVQVTAEAQEVFKRTGALHFEEDGTLVLH